MPWVAGLSIVTSSLFSGQRGHFLQKGEFSRYLHAQRSGGHMRDSDARQFLDRQSQHFHEDWPREWTPLRFASALRGNAWSITVPSARRQGRSPNADPPNRALKEVDGRDGSQISDASMKIPWCVGTKGISVTAMPSPAEHQTSIRRRLTRSLRLSSFFFSTVSHRYRRLGEVPRYLHGSQFSPTPTGLSSTRTFILRIKRIIHRVNDRPSVPLDPEPAFVIILVNKIQRKKKTRPAKPPGIRSSSSPQEKAHKLQPPLSANQVF